jgi:hypothetical protein
VGVVHTELLEQTPEASVELVASIPAAALPVIRSGHRVAHRVGQPGVLAKKPRPNLAQLHDAISSP